MGRGVAERIARNAGWNLAFLGTQTAASLITIPLILRGAGATDFGLYAFLLGAVSLAALVQAGVNLSVARVVARNRADGDVDRLRADLSFGYAFTVIVSMFQAAVIVAIPLIPGLLTERDQGPVTALTVILAIGTLLNGPTIVARGILVGLERFRLISAIETLPLMAGLAAAIGGIVSPVVRGIVVYAVAVEAARLVVGWTALVRAERLLPHLRRLHRPRRSGSDMTGFQAKQVGNQIADFLFYTADRFILQIVLGSAVVAHYAVAERANLLAQSLVSSPLVVLIPALATAFAGDNRRFIERVFVTGTRDYCLLTMPLLITLCALAPNLVEIWVGPGYADSGLVARLFLLCLVVAAPFKIYSHMRLAQGSIGFMTVTKLAYAPINAAASYGLSRELGLLGVVLPTVFFYCMVFPSAWTVSIFRRGAMPLFAAAVGRPLIAAILQGSVAVALCKILDSPSVLVTLMSATGLTLLGMLAFSSVGGGGRGIASVVEGRRAERSASDVDLASVESVSTVRI